MSEEAYQWHPLGDSEPSSLFSDWVEVESHLVYERRSDIPFVHQNPLGDGSFGWVDLVKQQDQSGRDHYFARKTIRIQSGRSIAQLESIYNEVTIAQRLRHRHITQVITTYLCKRDFGIIMLPVADINLKEWMEQDDISGTRSEEQLKLLPKWSQCLAHALGYIHDQKVRHKDIKPANVLIKGSDVLITDFGIAKDLIDDDTTGTTSTDVLRTRFYSAPEVMADHTRRGRAADIFSLGCIFVEMVTVFLQKSLVEFVNLRGSDGPQFCPYFASLDKTIQWTECLLETFDSMAQQVSISREWILLPLSLLRYEPGERPTAVELIQQLSAISFGNISRCQPCHNNTGIIAEEVASYDALHDYDVILANQDLLTHSNLTVVPPHASTTSTSSYQQSFPPAPPNLQQPYDYVHAMRKTQRMNPAEDSAPAAQPTHVDHGRPTLTATPRATQWFSSLPKETTLHNISYGKHDLRTPLNSPESVNSHASSLAATRMEKIYFTADDEGPPAISRRTPGKFNLITDRLAYSFNLVEDQFKVEESIPVHYASSGEIWVEAKFAVELLWRRPNEQMPRWDTFYIVPAHLLDSDVTLGSDEYAELQIIGMWDETPLNMFFDPDDTGEAFYQKFHRWAVRHEVDGYLDRQRTTLWLEANRNMPDNEAFELDLGVSELEELWKTAVDWMLESKNPKAPHLYATVKMEAG